MYYSVIVGAIGLSWSTGERIFEETDDAIAKRFKTGNRVDFVGLSRYPAILTEEFRTGDTSTYASIGYLDPPYHCPKISSPIRSFPANKLIDAGILSSKGWAGSRTRWMVFEGDPYRLLSAVLPVSVSGDSVNEEVVVKDRQIAVMMPFEHDATIDPVYRAIQEGSKKARFDCIRVDQFMEPADITDDIRKLIIESRAVIADLSGKNLNVMYEIGFAHGCNKKVVLISSDPLDGLPFDIRSQRVYGYSKNGTGLNDLTDRISSVLESMAEDN